tara:strand:+ start:309 stop:575 length:267 start_codon:yes stop_codon:yes gene_type:complete
MGFGGAVSAMLTTLKNNKRERKTRFDISTNNSGKNFKPFVDHKKSTPEGLKAIRLRLKAEQKAKNKKIAIWFGSAIILILILLFFLLF